MAADSILNDDEQMKVLEKNNILRLVQHHKENCNSCDCGVALWLVKRLAQRAGITFTNDELELFR